MARGLMRLSLKFNLFITALVLATALGVASLVTYRQLGDKYAQLLLRGRAIAAMAAQSGEYAVYTQGGEELGRQLHFLQNIPDVAYAAFLDRHFNLLAQRTFRGEVGAIAQAEERPVPQFPGFLLGAEAGEILELSEPVLGGGGAGETALFLDMNQPATEIIGYVRLGLSLESFRQDAIHSLRSALMTTLTMLGVGLALTMVMTRRIVSPVRRLADAAYEVAQGRLVAVGLDSGCAEIWDLAAAFNTMTERLGAYRRDVESYQEILERKAFVDELTGLANRALLKDHLALALEQARDGQMVAVLFLDLDRFKTINDSLGHGCGDQLLKDVAERLRQCVRAGDTVARMGGDEFVIVAPNLPVTRARDIADQLARRIGEALSAPIRLHSYEVNSSFSIGIALYPGDANDLEGLIKHADTAMYDAKANGRNTYRFYRPELSLGGLQRLTLESALRRALDRNEFELYLQPQYCWRRRQVIGAEALLRWRHAGNMVSPAEFIPLAEEIGLILPLGEWVMEQVCEIKRDWDAKGHCGPEGFQYLALNVSPRQFWHPGFALKTLDILERAAVAGLEIELTESCLMHCSEDVLHTFTRLREAGLRFSIDDFGTGYSSLAYLKQFPLDVLKIDQSFTRDCTEDDSDAAIVRAIIAMADGLGLEVIAEGVETEGQIEFLTRHGCLAFQGYYFGRPQPVGDFEREFLTTARNVSMYPQ